MISVIICSADPALLGNLKRNIHESIGLTHEILVYENSRQEKGICEIYNNGVRDAKYNILCFMHEDIEIHTPMWGLKIIDSFTENPRLGLLGVAGSSFKSFSPSGWDSTCMREKINFTNLLQKYRYSIRKDEQTLVSGTSTHMANVSVIDGVWFCSSKEILMSNPFDEKLLKKFHCYDIDISLAVGQNHDIAVSFDVLLTHFSEGNFNKDWVKETLLIHRKWKRLLPVNRAELSLFEIRQCEKKAFKSFIGTMRKSGSSAICCIRVVNRSGIRSKFGWWLYLTICMKCLTA